MGQGGYLQLINGTPYTWRRTEFWSYQLLDFKIPEVVPPGTSHESYLEFDQGWNKAEVDTEGKALYVLEGTNYHVRVQVRGKPMKISVVLDFSTRTINAGQWIDLGWKHDDAVRFILSGKDGNFNSSRPSASWMSANRATLGPRPLFRICMPGTHNSGVHKDSEGSFWRADTFTMCQHHSVRGQLESGARFFDIRPCIRNGQLVTGHYGPTGPEGMDRVWMGGRGESIADVVKDINDFTEHNAELIILDLSHAYDTDNGYQNLDDKQCARVLQELSGIKQLFHFSYDHNENLATRELDFFLGGPRHGKSSVLVRTPWSSLEVDDYYGKGFFPSRILPIFDQYADKDNITLLRQDQFEKLRKRPNDRKDLHLLAWALTQQFNTIGDLERIKSIEAMAPTAHRAAFADILNFVNNERFPNIIGLDFIDGDDFIALVMAINDKSYTNFTM